MSESFSPGTFCWVELGTTDRESARDFYSQLLGWDTQDQDMGEMGKYTLVRMEGKDIAGMYGLTDEMTQQGVPPHWMSYLKVTDADATAAKAEELGGTVVMKPFDVPNVGRMAFLQDPTGANFALFQGGQHQGAAPMDNKPGMFSWNELATKDPDAAKTFYAQLFGWSGEDQDMGPIGTYTSFKNGERFAGGMMKLPEALGDVPSNWMVYFAVGNCDESAEKAKGLGGDIKMPPTDIPEIGRFSVVTDPQGAVFSIIQLLNPEPN